MGVSASQSIRAVVAIAVFSMASNALAGTLGDVTGDGKVALPEATYALQVTAGLRSSFTTASEVTVVSKYIEISEINGCRKPDSVDGQYMEKVSIS